MQELTEFNIEKTTAEILILKDQTAQNIIEIGKRLIEVKENLEKLTLQKGRHKDLCK